MPRTNAEKTSPKMSIRTKGVKKITQNVYYGFLFYKHFAPTERVKILI